MAIVAYKENAPRPGGDAVQVKNGVIDSTFLYYMVDGKLKKYRYVGEFGMQLRSAAAIMQIALTFGLNTIWVCPGSIDPRSFDSDFIVQGQQGDEHTTRWAIVNPQYADGQVALCTFVKGWKKAEFRKPGEDGRPVGVGFAENGQWPFRQCQNPVTLLGAISYLEDAIGRSLAYSSSSVGRRLMARANNRSGRKDWIVPVDIRKFPKLISLPSPLQWQRPMAAEETCNPALVVYDKNSQYPAACTGVLLGSGEPSHIVRPVFDLKSLRPGVWKIRILQQPATGYPVLLPHPTDKAQEGWFWTYTVKLLIELGFQLDIEEAWCWAHDDGHTILRHWAEDLWRVRCLLNEKHQDCDQKYWSRDARNLAYACVKQIMNTSIGLLAKPPKNYEWSGAADWYRPDWDSLIVDKARYEMFKRIWWIWTSHRLAPIACDTDALYYPASTHDHAAAVPGMLTRPDKLGGYKPKYNHTIALSEVEHLFQRGEKIQRINRYIEGMRQR